MDSPKSGAPAPQYNGAVSDVGKVLIAMGGLLILAGAVVILAGRSHFPIGRLPGDIVYRGKHTTVYFPIVTSILLSIVLTLVFWILGRFSR
jgi:hypothetical protein